MTRAPVAQQTARILLRSKAVALRPLSPFRFASGLLSPIYCDNRILISLPRERRRVVLRLAQKVRDAAIPVDGRPVTVSIFDVTGRLVARRSLGSDAGMEWDGRLDQGGLAGAGVYFVQLSRGAETYRGRILITR